MRFQSFGASPESLIIIDPSAVLPYLRCLRDVLEILRHQYVRPVAKPPGQAGQVGPCSKECCLRRLMDGFLPAGPDRQVAGGIAYLRRRFYPFLAGTSKTFLLREEFLVPGNIGLHVKRRIIRPVITFHTNSTYMPQRCSTKCKRRPLTRSASNINTVSQSWTNLNYSCPFRACITFL